MPAERIFFGWKVVGATFVVAMFSFGVGFFGPAVILQTLHSTRGWAISTISASISTHFLFSALIGLYLPTIHARLGLGEATCAGCVSSGIGLVAWATAWEPWQLFPAALLTGMGYSVTSVAAVNAIIARWFERDRPKALSLALNGMSVGGSALVPLFAYSISVIGFPATAATVAIGMAALICPLARRYLTPEPSDFGLAPDGRPQQSAAVHPPKPGLTRTELLRDKRFRSTSAAFALAHFAQIGLSTHLIARLSPEFGVSVAAAAVSGAAILGMIARTLLGWLVGNRDRRMIAAANFAAQGTGALLLTIGNNTPVLALGCLLFGIGLGNLPLLLPLIAQKEFNRGDIALVVAMLTTINQAVFGLSPAFFGLLRDATATYAAPFSIAAIAYIISALIIAIGRNSNRPQ